MRKHDDGVERQFSTIEGEPGRSNIRRRYSKNSQSVVIPRKTEIKIIQLDEQVRNSSVGANVVQLQFGEEHTTLFKRPNHRKVNKKIQLLSEQRRNLNQKESLKNRYQQAYKESINYFFKNTMQIGAYVKSITADVDFNDPFCKTKLINIEKLAYPLRQTRRELTSRYKNKNSMSKTLHGNFSPLQQTKTSRNESIIKRQKRAISTNQDSSEKVFDELILMRKQIKLDYKKELQTLIPVRKPSNRKQYFVFGLSDRTNSSENKIQIFRDLIWKINYSNGLYVNTPENIITPYKFYVGQGNNSNLIRGILKRRFWWVQATNKNEEGINFLWTQLKINSIFSAQQVGTPLEYFVVERMKSQITKSTGSISWEEGDHRKIFGRMDYKIWVNHLSKNEKTEKKISEGTYLKRIKMYEKKKITKIEDSRLLKIHNHLQQNYYIGNKKALFYNLKKYLQLKGQNPFDVIPLTFHLSKGTEDPQYQNFVKFYELLEEEKKNKKQLKNMWIVKPGQNTNRGNGITVCYSIDDIKVRLKGRERNGDGKFRTFILQKYIENPMLYNKRKFDIRHYMLITCINGSFKGYWYEEGYIRTSSSQFNIKQCRDPLIHLTNDAIQKNTADYGKYEKANKLSYAQFQKYLETTYPNKKYNFYDQILPKMKLFATQSMKATYSILDPMKRKHNFELFGLDFMIDDDFNPWLIQVNTNPCLELCCPHLSRIIPSVVQNMFKICLDPLFPPPQNWPTNKKPYFGDDALSQNKFELIFDQASEGKQVEKIYNGQDKIDLKMGKIQQDDQTFQNEGQVEWENAQ